MRRTIQTVAAAMALAVAGVPAALADDAENTVEDFEQTYMAAPAVAGLLLEDAGIDNRFGTGKSGGNYIREVAAAMGPETDFNGIAKTDVTAYECAVADFLNGLDVAAAVTASATGVVDGTASSASATDNADGTVTLAVSVVDGCGDVIEGLSPVNDFTVMDSVIGGPFSFGTSAIPGSEAGNWTAAGGDYEITLERNEFNSRPSGYEDGWYRIWDILVDGTVVEDDLVLTTTYSAVGSWTMALSTSPTPSSTPNRWVTIASQTHGEITGEFGVGGTPDGDPTGDISGSIDGSSIVMNYVRTSGYEATFVGTIAPDGDGMSGTWTDNNSHPTPVAWSMTIID